MQFSTLLTSSTLLLAGSALVNAQATDKAQVQVVKVGGQNGELTFSPNSIKAAVGTYVQFQFWPKNHSVIQSTYDKPCLPIKQSTPEIAGFSSGFMPVAAGAKEMPVYTVQVKDEKPIWFYCGQGKHCNSGMVGVINAPASGEKTIEKHMELAKNAVGPAPSGTGNSYGSPTTMATGVASATVSGAPIQVTINAAPGRFFDSARNSVAGILITAVFALFAL